MSKINDRITQTRKLLKWIDQYPGWWQLICTPDDSHMNLEMMQLLIQKLAKQSFYEIILVLLMVHRNGKVMKGFEQTMLTQFFIREWEQGKQEELIEELIRFFD